MGIREASEIFRDNLPVLFGTDDPEMDERCRFSYETGARWMRGKAVRDLELVVESAVADPELGRTIVETFKTLVGHGKI